MLGLGPIVRRSWLARMTMTFAVMFTGLLVAVLLGVYLMSSKLAYDSIDATLDADLATFSETYTQRLLPGLREAVDRRAGDPTTRNIYLLLGRDGEILSGNRKAVPLPLGAPGDVIFKSNGQRFKGRLVQLQGGFRLFVAQSLAQTHSLLRRLAWTLVGFGFMALAVSLIGGHVVGRESLARVDALNATFRAVQSGDMKARPKDIAREDEFGELSRNLNQMLERMTALVEGFREVSQRVAHEMRTPLGHLRNSVEDLRSGAKPATREAFDDLIAETDHLLSVFGSLLDIATTEAQAGDQRGLKPVEVDSVLDDVVELYEAVAEERGVALSIVARSGASMLGDRQLLVQMLANVVDNAIKFTPSGGAISIASEILKDALIIRVDDQGPGLPEGFETRAFERFSRAVQSQSVPGHGLGLALVKAIAIRHGIKVELSNLKPGLRVIMRAHALAKA